MSDESYYRSKVVRMLRPVGGFAVENLTKDGCPDICSVPGWIEMKLGTWPKRDGVVVVDMRNSQRIWHRMWRRHNGRSWTLTIVDKEWFLHDGQWSADRLGLSGVQEFRENAITVWGGGPTADQLIRTLTKRG